MQIEFAVGVKYRFPITIKSEIVSNKVNGFKIAP